MMFYITIYLAANYFRMRYTFIAILLLINYIYIIYHFYSNYEVFEPVINKLYLDLKTIYPRNTQNDTYYTDNYNNNNNNTLNYTSMSY